MESFIDQLVDWLVGVVREEGEVHSSEELDNKAMQLLAQVVDLSARLTCVVV